MSTEMDLAAALAEIERMRSDYASLSAAYSALSLEAERLRLEVARLSGGETWWMLARGSEVRPILYPSEPAGLRALGKPGEDSAGSEIERQRRDGWAVVRVRIVPDPCGLCGQPWAVGHACPREEP